MWTEKDAREKWCPMARYASDSGFVANRWENFACNKVGKYIPNPCLCVGYDCMAWRECDDNPDFGYCGLAGKPQGGLADNREI